MQGLLIRDLFKISNKSCFKRRMEMWIERRVWSDGLH